MQFKFIEDENIVIKKCANGIISISNQNIWNLFEWVSSFVFT